MVRYSKRCCLILPLWATLGWVPNYSIKALGRKRLPLRDLWCSKDLSSPGLFDHQSLGSSDEEARIVCSVAVGAFDQHFPSSDPEGISSSASLQSSRHDLSCRLWWRVGRLLSFQRWAGCLSPCQSSLNLRVLLSLWLSLVDSLSDAKPSHSAVPSPLMDRIWSASLSHQSPVAGS